ncbi:MAG: hypothetical protein P8K76_10745 [Candidatus Binatia bacterium]|nr:hypothetical protein [Candidatus Binatia bacterium]MDG1959689.1 hypothetical protein [Candidatus Binatia bacterium]MDG2010250.1 hypothetical protein [Candidatus Binatia bacterium]HAC80263.1 hypothetical protein [Deltaproteobacteria bacterium]|tara:strand:+ start:85 stop:387 length:303 start_codon:yes stop_codon:yes gene_type:complete
MTSFDALESAHRDIVPRLQMLCDAVRDAGEKDQLVFFDEIRVRIEKAHSVDELLEPFMALSTSAFRGFAMNWESIAILDEVLETSSHISEILARGEETVH